MLAACPTHIGADIGLDELHGVVDGQPAVTTPPGLLIYRWMSLSGFSDSRNSNWATTRLATLSSMLPPQ